MTRPVRIAFISASAMLVLIVIVVIGGFSIVQSDWFYNKVRKRLVTEVEKATGGTVEIGVFRFDWKTLTATVDRFVVHGSEPRNGPPLLSVDRLTLGLKIISFLKRDVDIALLRADVPKAFLLLQPDGSTNIPRPKAPSASTKSGAETILDLAIGRFELNNGLALVQQLGAGTKTTPFQARGEQLHSILTFDAAGPRYSGSVAVHPLTVAYGEDRPLPVNADVNLIFEKDRLQVSSAHLATEKSHADLNGSLDHFAAPVVQANYRAAIDLEEIGGLLGLKSRQSGTAKLEGDGRYVSTTDYSASAKLQLQDVRYAQGTLHLTGIHGNAVIAADPVLVKASGLRLYAAGGEITGEAEVRDLDRLRVAGRLSGFDLANLARTFANQRLPYDGIASGPFQLEARLKELQRDRYLASARISITPAAKKLPVQGLIDARYDGAGANLVLAKSFLALPSTRLDFSGELNSELKVQAQTSNLGDLQPVIGQSLPVSLDNGSVLFSGSVRGKVSNPEVSGHLSASNVVYAQQKIDSAGADILLQRNGAEIRNGTIAYQSLRGKMDASVGLTNWKALESNRVRANVSLANADLSNILKLAGQSSITASGVLQATVQVTGTLGNPQATADATVARGMIQKEPFDRITAHLESPSPTQETLRLAVIAGPKQLNATANYAHASGEFLPGTLNFQTKTNPLQLADIRNVHSLEPSLSGIAQADASGRIRLLAPKAKQSSFLIETLNGNLTASKLQVEQRDLGDAKITARTNDTPQGPLLTAHVESDVARSNIRGDAQFHLVGDYPGSGQITFSQVDLANVRALILPSSSRTATRLTGSIEGKLTFSGPALKPEQLTGELNIPHIEARPIPAPGDDQTLAQFSIHNTEPVRVTLRNQRVTVESAHLVSRNTDLRLSGSVDLKNNMALDLRADGTAGLGLVHLFEPDIFSSGQVVLQAMVRGTAQAPQAGGYLDLKNANFNLIDAPNGLSNANGRIQFDGSRATIQTLTAETGGGKVSLSGFAVYTSGLLNFRVNADARGVRVRYPEGVSTTADATLNLTGTTEKSVLAGDVIVQRIAFNPRTDLGSILSASGAPVKTPSAQTGLIGNMQFDVQIATSPDISFQTALTQSLQAEANLRLRGTISNPVLLGRINITQGDLTFFGNKYVINQGSISFFNPVRLEPILNVDLETQARGVDVTLTLSGPINKLNVSYRSDPPLQFSDIVALLATGRAPQNATIAARQSTQAPQSWQQMGASAIVGQAIANPVAGRLQRFFGVSKLKIDPQLSGVTGNPQARLTVEQQVTPDITFTYITDVANTSTQIIRVEWALSKTWSAVALREENGYFGLDFFYKKRFK